jgi:hypothetical protein
MRVLCDCNPYCFGSTSTMRAVLAEMPEAEVVVLCSGASLDLCPDLTVVETDVKDPACLRTHSYLLDWADVYVAFSNNTNVPEVVARGVPLVFVDIHYELKRGLTPAMEHARAYVIESHPGVSRSLERWRPKSPRMVGPIVAPGRRRDRAEHAVLVNIGGASSPDIRPGINTDYPARVTCLAQQLSQSFGYLNVPVAMGSAAAASVRRAPGAHATTFSPPDYLSYLENSRILLTAPGLNAPMEGFVREIPVVFLPPQNFTQVTHLRTYAEAGLAPMGERLLSLVPGGPIDGSRSESEGSAAVLRSLANLGDPEWEDIRGIVEEQLRWSRAELAVLAARQHAWAVDLGVGGAAEVARAIRSVLQ